MKRLLIVVCVLLLSISVVPAIGEIVTLHASGAETGDGVGASTQITGVPHNKVVVQIAVTAGVATVTNFEVGIEGSLDGGTTFTSIFCDAITDGTDTLRTTINIIDETVLVTSASYYGECDGGFALYRAFWVLAGTTPSETFVVRVSPRN